MRQEYTEYSVCLPSPFRFAVVRSHRRRRRRRRRRHRRRSLASNEVAALWNRCRRGTRIFDLLAQPLPLCCCRSPRRRRPRRRRRRHPRRRRRRLCPHRHQLTSSSTRLCRRRRRGHHRHGRRGCGRCCLLVVSPCTLLSHACLFEALPTYLNPPAWATLCAESGIQGSSRISTGADMRQEYTINASRRPGPSSFALLLLLLLLLLLSPRRRRRRRCRPCRRRRPHPPKLMTKVFSSIVTRRCHRRRRHRRRRWHGFGPYNSRRVLMFLPGFSAHEATPALSKLYWSTFNHARGQQPGTYVRDVAKCTRREHHNLPCPTSGSCAALPIELSLATTGSDFWDVPEIGRSAFQRT